MHMTEPDDDPIWRPWIVKALRRRPKLVEIETREQFLENLEENMCERRRPDNIADRLSILGLRSAEGAAEPVVKTTMSQRFQKANRKRLRRL